MDQFLKLGTDPYEVIRLFPDLVSQSNVNENNEPVATMPKLQDRDLENGLLALIAYLTEVRHKLMGDTQSKDKDKNEKGKSMTAVATEQLLKIIDTTLLKCYLQVIIIVLFLFINLLLKYLLLEQRVLRYIFQNSFV